MLSRYEKVLASFMVGFIGLSAFAIWYAYVTPMPPMKREVWAFNVPRNCMPYLSGYIAGAKTSILSANKYRHMAEMLTVCEAGKDPTSVDYKEITKADEDSILRRAILDQMRCGGMPCAVHTGVPRPPSVASPITAR